MSDTRVEYQFYTCYRPHTAAVAFHAGLTLAGNAVFVACCVLWALCAMVVTEHGSNSFTGAVVEPVSYAFDTR